VQIIDDYINSARSLPPPPRIVPELMHLLKQPDVNSSKVVKLISFDSALTTEVLRVCNSAFSGSATPTSHLQEAVTRLGFQHVFQVVAAAMGARILGAAQRGYGFDEGELWRHSVAAAVAAQVIAKKLGDNDNLAFTAALLHDVGKIVLSQPLEPAHSQLVRETEADQLSLLESERKILGTEHAETGARLLERWRFPPEIVSAVWFHHAPRGAGASRRLASQLHLADIIAHFAGHGCGPLTFAVRGRGDAFTILGLTSESLPMFMMNAFDEMQKVESLLSIPG
jgi:putative nucleotidyltransferase with HDIG domain